MHAGAESPPIGGHFTIDPVAAAYAVELLGVDAVAPIHYGTFPILAGTPSGASSRSAAWATSRSTTRRREARSAEAALALAMM
jgi:L-ascorbate metabolism protein UlaG (beta-lactamase superfamily)